MINNNQENNPSGNFKSEANGPTQGANSSFNSSANSDKKYSEPFSEESSLEANAINGEESSTANSSQIPDASGTTDEADFSTSRNNDFTAASGISSSDRNASTANAQDETGASLGADYSSDSNFSSESSGIRKKVSGMKEKLNQMGHSQQLGKVKDIGRKGMGPIMDVLQKYKGDINPYFDAISKGLKASVDALNTDSSSDADKTVGKWFKEAADWFENSKSRLTTSDATEFLSFIEDEAQRRPGLMFSISYLAGLGFGRVGRHIGHLGHKKMEGNEKPSSTIH